MYLDMYYIYMSFNNEWKISSPFSVHYLFFLSVYSTVPTTLAQVSCQLHVSTCIVLYWVSTATSAIGFYSQITGTFVFISHNDDRPNTHHRWCGHLSNRTSTTFQQSEACRGSLFQHIRDWFTMLVAWYYVHCWLDIISNKICFNRFCSHPFDTSLSHTILILFWYNVLLELDKTTTKESSWEPVTCIFHGSQWYWRRKFQKR